MTANHDGLTGDQVPFLIRRSPAPAWLDDPAIHEEPRIRDALGDQAQWGFATPWIYRALASPFTRESFVQAPKRGDDIMRGPGAYWTALLNLMIYRLGWVRPDRGLRWWYDRGKPIADRTLQLVSQIWDADGQLDWFAAWLWSTTYSTPEPGLLKEATGYVIDAHGPVVPDHDRWLQDRFKEANASSIPAPVTYHGGGDQLHLSVHINGPLLATRGKPLLVRTTTAERRAVLMLDSMIGWYRALATESRSLPKLSGHSWRVDVVVKPVGWLGTYRKSAETGLWFAGRHSVHVRGV